MRDTQYLCSHFATFMLYFIHGSDFLSAFFGTKKHKRGLKINKRDEEEKNCFCKNLFAGNIILACMQKRTDTVYTGDFAPIFIIFQFFYSPLVFSLLFYPFGTKLSTQSVAGLDYSHE